jgi:hypothetical protein
MNVTFYKVPNGTAVPLAITNVDPDDAAWFQSVGARVSMEETGGQFVCYADVGVVDEDGEPDEAVEIAAGRTCEETLKALRIQAQELLTRQTKEQP